MFNIEPGTFKRTVKIPVPVDDGFEEQSVVITYNVMPIDRTRALETGQDVVDFVHETVNTVDGLVDGKKNPLEWNAEVQASFWNLPYVFNPVRDAYAEAINKAREKN